MSSYYDEIMRLKRDTDMNQSQIARRLKISRQAVSQAINYNKKNGKRGPKKGSVRLPRPGSVHHNLWIMPNKSTRYFDGLTINHLASLVTRSHWLNNKDFTMDTMIAIPTHNTTIDRAITVVRVTRSTPEKADE